MIKDHPHSSYTPGLTALAAIVAMLATCHYLTVLVVCSLVERLTASMIAASIGAVFTWFAVRAFIVKRLGRWLRRSLRAIGERHHRDSKRPRTLLRLFIAAVFAVYGNPLYAEIDESD